MTKALLASLLLAANITYADMKTLGADGPAAISDLLVTAIIEKADKAGLSCETDSEDLAKILTTKNKALFEAFKKKQVKDFFVKLGVNVNTKKVFDAAILLAAEELCSDEEPVDEEEPLPDDETMPE